MDVLQLQTEAKEELLDVQENNEYNLHFEPSKVVHFKNPELSLAERDTLKLHPCDVCQKLCLGTSLSRHRRKEHPEVKPLQCYYCTFQCASPSGLSRHRRKFHYERKGFELYKCLPCGIIYEPISAYNQHMTEFHSVPSSSLTSFNTTSSRRIVHPLSQPKNCFYFRCPYCDDRDCKNEKGLKNHMSRFHSSQPRILYQCKSCPYKTNRRAEFCGHMRCHTRKSNFDCTHCTASFSTTDMLEMHSKKYASGTIWGAYPSPKAKEIQNGTTGRKKCIRIFNNVVFVIYIVLPLLFVIVYSVSRNLHRIQMRRRSIEHQQSWSHRSWFCISTSKLRRA